MTSTQKPIQRGKLFLITLGHFWIDSYANIQPALLPLVILQMDLSLTLAGILASVFSLSSSLTQTVMGYLADRMRVRYFVVLGLLFSAVFICSIGLASDYWTLLVILALGGLGISAFHPQTVTMAGEISGSHRGLGVSLFVAGGTAGYALSPYWITVLVSEYSIDILPYAAIPGIVTVGLLMWLVPMAKEPHEHAPSFTIREAFQGRLRPIMLLTSTVIARSVTRLGMMAFLPIMLTSQGMTLVDGGKALTTFTFLGAIGSLVGGTLSDRIGRRMIITLSMVGSGPLLYAALQSEGGLFFLLLGLGGFMLFLADAVVVATAQELAPERAAIASSMVMGFGWGIGGLAVMAVGGLSDAIGIPATLSGVALIPVVGAVCCFGLPKDSVAPYFPEPAIDSTDPEKPSEKIAQR
ncbi:MAG: MFS transporter [Candidatus Latescibacteria bacterium]|jgi:MFS transporter, FSR family, fosmidomycin resistance protein|nr:MFS transporter [Candidatus Latescibacterota bacterium]